MLSTILLILNLIVSPPTNVYQFSFKTIDGKTVKLSQFKGKKILIVNTASKCGFTPQYEDLEKLHKMYGNKVVVLGFPEGDFGGQEFSTNAEIKEFCTGTYKVSFTLAEKSSVIGNEISPLFKYLTSQKNTEVTGDIKWNFEKFLINEKGELVHRYRSQTTPLDVSITKYL